MDAAKVQKLRRSYPDHVPVICEPENEGEKHKLIVPHHKTGAELVQLAREKCPWASADSKVKIKIGHKEVPKSCRVKDLDDPLYQANDGVLYLQVTRKRKSELLPGQRNQSEKVRRMREKYPDRVPVLINQAACPGLPRIEKKLLVPGSMTVGDLRKSLPKHLKGCDVPWEKVRMLMAGDEVQDDQLMMTIYDSCVDHDGGLHLALELDKDVPVGSLDVQAACGRACCLLPPALLGPRIVVGPEIEALRAQLAQANTKIEEVEQLHDDALAQCADEEERAEMAEDREVEALNQLEKAKMCIEDLQKELTEKDQTLAQTQSQCMEAKGVAKIQDEAEEEPPRKRRKTFGSLAVDVARMAAFSMAGHVFGGGPVAAGVGFTTACVSALQ